MKPRAREKEFPCKRCGRCCLEPFYRHVSPEDVARWESQGRFDILAAVEEERNVLENQDPVMGLKKFRPCRFNVREGEHRTSCAIYPARPRMCAEFVPGRSKLCPAGKE